MRIWEFGIAPSPSFPYPYPVPLGLLCWNMVYLARSVGVLYRLPGFGFFLFTIKSLLTCTVSIYLTLNIRFRIGRSTQTDYDLARILGNRHDGIQG